MNIKAKYIGNKKGIVLKRTELSKEYDFSDGIIEVEEADAKIMQDLWPRSFKFAKPKEDTSDNTEAVTGK